jgi:hypothetical protein
MTPYERLMSEAIPVRPPPAPKPTKPKPAAEPWTPEEQARHRAELMEALADWHWDDDSRADQRRHLRLVRQADAA